MKYLVLLICSFAALLCSQTAQAQASRDEGWQWSLSAGHGKISTPLSGRHAIQGDFIPSVSYYGERFYLENTHLGYSLIEEEHLYIDLVGELNQDGMFYEFDGVNNFGWWEAIGISRTGGEMPSPVGEYQDIERKLSYMAGVSSNFTANNSTVRISVLTDISGVHHGSEFRLDAKHDMNWGDWQLQINAGLARKNSNLINYYYNLRPWEIDNKPSWFVLNSAWNAHYGATLRYQFNEHWALLAHWQRELLDRDIQRSPLVLRNNYLSRFVGVRYDF